MKPHVLYEVVVAGGHTTGSVHALAAETVVDPAHSASVLQKFKQYFVLAPQA